MTDNEYADRPDRFSVVHRMVDGVRVVTVRGEIDHDVKTVLGNALLAPDEAAPPSRIVVDLSGVTFMDSSGINVFVTAHQAVSGDEGWVRIAAAQKPVLHVLRLVGIDALITCHPTVEQALEP
ncbi:STAS domain-containing protein [Streptomyces rishiriensis]|uniref:Anti-sigma factor antagonist n=1 Tax=Streptomyces rishiriensis TaxID=68264 RepID=A0ABU0P1Z4_STRRH|nr:STAS domain-containing protein [Streptomyces rishiriensis]MDQ0585379.1 stage II sporulation protein AA (anti-sigma F factor antagonist) [Streptomyces rishiriensis]